MQKSDGKRDVVIFIFQLNATVTDVELDQIAKELLAESDGDLSSVRMLLITTAIHGHYCCHVLVLKMHPSYVLWQ
jgi:hypothetical protein